MKMNPQFAARRGLTAACFGLAIALVLTPGCRRDHLTSEVAEFSAALDAGLAAVAAYYTDLNEREYDLYFQLLELDADFEVGDYIIFDYAPDSLEADLKGKDNPGGTDLFAGADADTLVSPLKKPPFSKEAIETRVRILDEMAEYGRSLAALAGSDEPERFQAGVSGLEYRLTALLESIEGSDSSASASHLSAAGYIPALSKIVKIVGTWHLESLRWNAVKDAVIEAQPSVDTILDKIAEDLDLYVEPVSITWHDDWYTTAIDYYNHQRLNRSQDWRRAALRQIREYKQTLDAARLHPPSTIPKQLKSAHGALVEVARSNGAPEDLDQLRVELELFKEEVDQLCAAVAVLRGYGKDGLE